MINNILRFLGINIDPFKLLFTARENEVIGCLASKQGISKEKVLIQALRLYQREVDGRDLPQLNKFSSFM